MDQNLVAALKNVLWSILGYILVPIVFCNVFLFLTDTNFFVSNIGKLMPLIGFFLLSKFSVAILAILAVLTFWLSLKGVRKLHPFIEGGFVGLVVVMGPMFLVAAFI